MDNCLAPGTVLGYCTNVHAGAGWEETRANLERYALRVKELVSPEAPMGIGLWLSAASARDVLQRIGVPSLNEWLAGQGLNVFTLNGFPQGDFHQPRVKHRVYRPDWGEDDRLDYTLNLTEILAGLMEAGQEGSISTLPLGWGKREACQLDLETAAANLIRVARHLHTLEQETGKWIHLDLEPEPGCCLDRFPDVLEFFKDRLLRHGEEEVILRHLRVCHDICHSAVVFEDPIETLEAYSSAGIQIGKVQVSSAIRIDFDSLESDERVLALSRLKAFQEDRYLHQSVLRVGREIRFFEDLPPAVSHLESDPAGELRVHFHVPIFLESDGPIATTRDRIVEGVRHLLKAGKVRHFEVETYAWEVLPKDLRAADLSQGIAREIQWLRENLAS